MKRSLCLSMLAVLALAPAVQAADLLVDNVNGYTLDSHGKLQHFQALLVNKGKVVATGSHAELAGRAGRAKVIDGGGRTLLPGLIDAHGHVLDLGYARNSVDLTGTTSLDEALAKVKAYAAAHPEAKWILGGG
ncbi:amidohydrolase family protein [Rhodanobacter lindaniclasticus]